MRRPHALALALIVAAGAATAAWRDPMQPPPGPAPAGAAGTAEAPSALPASSRHLMVVDGRRYVVEAGRRRAVGDLLGGARIERIEDSAVVVRANGVLQRLPLFDGVSKRLTADAAATPLPRPARAPKPRTDSASRAGGQ